MPTNEIYKEAAYIPLTVGASVAARNPVLVGKVPGVTLTATGASGTQVATVATEGVFKLSVHADNGGSTTIAAGDIIYFSGTNASPVLDVNTGGTRWGYALEANSASGTSSTIKCLVGY
jgi:predicted RecA/RadA family phage recombinase